MYVSDPGTIVLIDPPSMEALAIVCLIRVIYVITFSQ